jgi:hypothetical protein
MTVLPAAPASSLPDQLAELSRTLWAQRGLIETLQYRLEVQQLVCVGGRAQWLQKAVDEVEAALEDMRRSERRRDGVVAACAASLGLDPAVSLSELRVCVPDPWGPVLGEHQDALLALVETTESLAAANREVVNRGIQDARALLHAVGGVPGPDRSYGPVAMPAAGAGVRPTLLDRNA